MIKEHHIICFFNMRENPQHSEGTPLSRTRVLSVLLATALSSGSMACAKQREEPSRKPVVSCADEPKPIKVPTAQPGILNKLNPEKSCDIQLDSFRRLDAGQKFLVLAHKCKGEEYYRNMLHITTTIPGYGVNEELFRDLDDVVMGSGLVKSGEPAIKYRQFILHRMDGKDGLPGGNVVSYELAGISTSRRGFNHSYSSIPMEGERVKDAGALGKEICRTRLMLQRNLVDTLTTCSSFEEAIKSTYNGQDYEGYMDGVRNTVLNAEGKNYSMNPVSPSIYKNLEGRLADHPDVLVEVKKKK